MRLGRGGGALGARLDDVEAGMAMHPRAVRVTARSLSVTDGLLEVGLAKTLHGEHNGADQEMKEGLHYNLSRVEGRAGADIAQIRQALMLPKYNTFDKV